MKENYFSKKYEINSKIREMIEKKMGKKVDLPYVQIEMIISILYKAKYKSLTSTLTENDKLKVISYLKETSPNSFKDDVSDNIILFLKDNFTDDEIKSYINYCINKYYNPGRTYKGIKVSNSGVINLISKTDLYNMKDGLIINKTDANDIINYFGIEEENIKFKYDGNLTIIDKDFTTELIEKFDNIKMDFDIEYYTNDDIFIIVSNDEKSTEYLKEQFDQFNFEKILDFPFYDKKEESDTMDLGNGMVMKGNFTKLGNVGGTQIIGVGSGTGNSVLDKLMKEDSMDMITRIMNGDMSRCGKGDEDENNINDNNNGNNNGNEDTNVLENDFPYKKVFDFATVWLRKKPRYGDIGHSIDHDELTNEDGYEKFDISKGTMVGFGEQNWDNGDMEIQGIIEYTKNGYYYNYDEGFISDGIITFELENGVGYVPSEEPVNLLETSYQNGGGTEINNISDTKKLVKLYNLSVLLTGV